MRYEQKASDRKRGATFSERKVRCPNAYDSKAMLAYGAEACPGDIVVWKSIWKGESDEPFEKEHVGRVIGRVDAYAIGECPKVEGHIAVLLFSADLHHAYEVWVNPADVRSVARPSPKLMAFLLQEKLPAIPDLLKLSRDGALCERYIERATEK